MKISSDAEDSIFNEDLGEDEEVKFNKNDILTMIRNRKELTAEQKARAIKLPNVMFAGVSEQDKEHILNTIEAKHETGN